MSFEIPVDKIGEVIGPKGKVINAIQQETGADVNVDDDGTVGIVTIGAKQRSVVDEARRRIELILDPPTPEVGAVYRGRVVNITKFGAFVNILPGRDGLVHISRLGQGRRVERVEDVLTLGQEVEVRVDEIDPQGKVSLSLAGEARLGRACCAERASRAQAESRSEGDNGGGRHSDSRARSGRRWRPRRRTRPAALGAAPRSRTRSRASSSRPSATSDRPRSPAGRRRWRAPRGPRGGGRGGPGGGVGGARRRPRSGGR